MKKSVLLLVLLVGINGGCHDSKRLLTGGRLSTTPTPTWGDLIVDVATSRDSINPANLIRALTFEAEQLQIDEARVVIRDIRFDLADDNYSTPRFEGPFIVNLISGGEIVDQVYPDIGEVRVVPGSYDAALLRLDSIDASEIPSDLNDSVVDQYLVGESVVVQGRFLESSDNDMDGDSQQSTIPFTFIGDTAETIEISTTDPFVVVEYVDNYVFLTFRVDEWFHSILTTLQQLPPSTLDENGELVISDQGSEELVNAVDAIETDIEESYGLAISGDEVFDAEEEDPLSQSDQEDQNYDSECYNSTTEDWNSTCLELLSACEDTCYSTDCFDDILNDWIQSCVDVQDRCSKVCWSS